MVLRRDVYSGRLKLLGEEHKTTFIAALNYASALHNLNRFEEAKALLRKTMPAARRILGENHDITITMKWHYSWALYKDAAATLDDLREAVTRLEELAPIARRVMGGAHPTTTGIGDYLRVARAVLRDREAPPTSG